VASAQNSSQPATEMVAAAAHALSAAISHCHLPLRQQPADELLGSAAGPCHAERCVVLTAPDRSPPRLHSVCQSHLAHSLLSARRKNARPRRQAYALPACQLSAHA